MDVFKRHDLVGVGMAMLFLVLIYLLLHNFYATSQVTGQLLSGWTGMLKTLQGR